MKPHPWLFLAPALAILAVSAFVPLMTVVNYSVHNIFAGSRPRFVGLENYAEVLADPAFRGALARQLGFSGLVLLIQIPLGIAIAHTLPRRGPLVAVCLMLLGIPLLIPHIVVGIIWRLLAQDDLGVIPALLEAVGHDYNVSLNPWDAWTTILVLDVWHWTPLVVLLSYAGLQSIPDAYYRAAQIDGASRWSTFRHVTLPKLRPVIVIGVLLRLMDSFTIYSEPLMLTGGGPGNSTTFLSMIIVRKSESYDLGYAGAASIIYLYLVILMCYLFFQAIAGKRATEAA